MRSPARIVTDVELYLADVRLPRDCCERVRGEYAVKVWRRGKAWRKARRLLHKIKELRERIIIPGEERKPMRLFGMEIRVHAAIGPDEVYMIDGRRIVAGRRAFAEEVRPARRRSDGEGGRVDERREEAPTTEPSRNRNLARRLRRWRIRSR